MCSSLKLSLARRFFHNFSLTRHSKWKVLFPVKQWVPMGATVCMLSTTSLSALLVLFRARYFAFASEMSSRKGVFGCEGKLTIFSLPKDSAILDQRMWFVFPGQQHSPEKVWICLLHFEDNGFMNKAQNNAGFTGDWSQKSRLLHHWKGTSLKPMQWEKLFQMSVLR